MHLWWTPKYRGLIQYTVIFSKRYASGVAVDEPAASTYKHNLYGQLKHYFGSTLLVALLIIPEGFTYLCISWNIYTIL